MRPSGVPTLTMNSGIFLVHRDLDEELPDEGSTFVRESGARALAKALDTETVDAFLAETKSKPEQAMRAAAAALFTLPITGIDARLAQLLSAPASPSFEPARRLLLEAPVSGGIEQLL